MPETAVDKDSQADPREHNVGLASHALHGSDVLPVSESSSVKRSSEYELRARIARAVGLHRATDAR